MFVTNGLFGVDVCPGNLKALDVSFKCGKWRITMYLLSSGYLGYKNGEDISGL